MRVLHADRETRVAETPMGIQRRFARIGAADETWAIGEPGASGPAELHNTEARVTISGNRSSQKHSKESRSREAGGADAHEATTSRKSTVVR